MSEYYPDDLMVYRDDSGQDTKYDCFDREMFTYTESDVRYTKVGDDLVGTALRLLHEAGYNVEINIKKNED